MGSTDSYDTDNDDSSIPATAKMVSATSTDRAGTDHSRGSHDEEPASAEIGSDGGESAANGVPDDLVRTDRPMPSTERLLLRRGFAGRVVAQPAALGLRKYLARGAFAIALVIAAIAVAIALSPRHDQNIGCPAGPCPPNRTATTLTAATSPSTTAATEPINAYVKPVTAVLTGTFGSQLGMLHQGIDLAAPIGTPIFAVTGGSVIDAGPTPGFGLWIRLRHPDGTITLYGHLDTLNVSKGQIVTAGQQIATVGNTGFSPSGPHLHFEVHPHGGDGVDPQPWLATHGITYTNP